MASPHSRNRCLSGPSDTSRFGWGLSRHRNSRRRRTGCPHTDNLREENPSAPTRRPTPASTDRRKWRCLLRGRRSQAHTPLAARARQGTQTPRLDYWGWTAGLQRRRARSHRPQYLWEGCTDRALYPRDLVLVRAVHMEVFGGHAGSRDPGHLTSRSTSTASASCRAP